jgi:large subunit ribosomal protein L32e
MDSKQLRKIRSRFGKPDFPRPYHWTRSKLGISWRRPKGIDNKLRHSFKGYPVVVKVGYRTPVSVRGLHPSGKRQVLVQNQKELFALDPKTECAVISSKVGGQKRLSLESLAAERGITVVNEKHKTQMVSQEQGSATQEKSEEKPKEGESNE